MSDLNNSMPIGNPNALENAALRKLVYRLAGNPDDESLGEAATTAAERIDELEERIEELEAGTGINLQNADYKDLSRAAKVKKIVDALHRRQENNTNDRAVYEYKDVKALFDDHPSGGHAHDLLERAGQRDGVEFLQPPDKKDRLVVTPEKES